MARSLVVFVVTLTLTVTFAGCLWFGGHCGPYYDDATWREPGLYEALGPERQETADRGGFAFDHPMATARWGTNVTVAQVYWEPTAGDRRGHEDVRVHLVAARPDGNEGARGARVGGDHISMMAPGDTPNETWVRSLRTMMAATNTTPDDVDTWIAAFLEDRETVGFSHDPRTGIEQTIRSSARAIEGAPDLEALAEQLGTPAPDTGHRSTGSTTLRWATENGTWSFHVLLPVRAFDAGDLDTDEAVTVRVDPTGEVTADMPQELGNQTEVYQERLTQRFQAAGLPAPSYDGFEAHAAIC